MDAFSQLENPITAVFVSDETALGIISRCYEIGKSVPDDISAIGYDNSKDFLHSHHHQSVLLLNHFMRWENWAVVV